MVGSDDTFDDQERLTERECVALFERVFPSGLGGEDVLDEIAPTGWERSPLLAVFHPSVEQIYRETVRVRQNIRRLTGRMPARAADPDPTLAEIAASHVERPIERDVEIRELVGRCLWDIFSDNHDVIGPDGRLADIGSFRGAGAFIAELVNRELPDARYDYLDFYMGTICVSDRADLTPVYAMIFRRLAEHGYDWKYAFPAPLRGVLRSTRRAARCQPRTRAGANRVAGADGRHASGGAGARERPAAPGDGDRISARVRH